MKINLGSLGKLALGLARKMASDLVVKKAQELIITAENSGLSGEEKMRQVKEKLRAVPGDVGQLFGNMPAYLQNLLIESLLADALERLKPGA